MVLRKNVCIWRNTHILELQRKPSAFGKSGNILDPDNLVTEEGTQGPDSK